MAIYDYLSYTVISWVAPPAKESRVKVPYKGVNPELETAKTALIGNKQQGPVSVGAWAMQRLTSNKTK